MQNYVVFREELGQAPLDRLNLYNSFFARDSKYRPFALPIKNIDPKEHQIVTFYNFLRSPTKIFGTIENNHFYPAHFRESPDVTNGLTIDDCIVIAAQGLLLHLTEEKRLYELGQLIPKTDIITLGAVSLEKTRFSVVTSILVDDDYRDELSNLFVPSENSWLDISEVKELIKDFWMYDFL